MIRNLLLDADDTLFDFRKSEHLALKRALSQMNLPSDSGILDRYSIINSEYWKKLERKELTRSELRVQRFRQLLEEMGVDAPFAELADFYESYLAEGHFFIDGALEVLQNLSGRYRLYLVSNGSSRTQRGRLKSADVGRYFQDIFISQEIGIDKPNLGYYEACFARIPDFSKEETLAVGDSLTSDILGGIRAGLRTVWFNVRKQPANPSILPTYEINSLRQLPALIERINESDLACRN